MYTHRAISARIRAHVLLINQFYSTDFIFNFIQSKNKKVNKYQYTILQLEMALKNVEENNNDLLIGLVDKVFKEYDQRKFHDIYSNECNVHQDHNPLELYLQFKLRLLYIFFDSADKTSPAYNMYFIGERDRPFIQQGKELDDLLESNQLNLNEKNVPTIKSNRLSIISDCIVQHIIYRTDSTYKSILEVLQKHRDFVANDYSTLFINVINSFTITPKLIDSQIELLKKYDTINPSKWIQVCLNDDDQILLNADPNYNLSMRDLNDDTLLQMYLLGDPSILPIMYKHAMTRNADKVESQKAYDNFVMWLWKFKNDKKKNRLVPPQLKSLCIEILQLVSGASTGTSYTKYHFNNPKTAWEDFSKANKNAIKRQVKK